VLGDNDGLGLVDGDVLGEVLGESDGEVDGEVEGLVDGEVLGDVEGEVEPPPVAVIVNVGLATVESGHPPTKHEFGMVAVIVSLAVML
jgi:hypothetical protein